MAKHRPGNDHGDFRFDKHKGLEASKRGLFDRSKWRDPPGFRPHLPGNRHADRPGRHGPQALVPPMTKPIFAIKPGQLADMQSFHEMLSLMMEYVKVERK